MVARTVQKYIRAGLAACHIEDQVQTKRCGHLMGKQVVSREEFERWISEGRFLEWAEYSGNLYGTPEHPVEESMDRGLSVILEIELQGARKGKPAPAATGASERVRSERMARLAARAEAIAASAEQH